MDPSETLAQLRAWSKRVLEQADAVPARNMPEAVEGAELFQALDGWMTTGGLCPAPWGKR